MSERSQFRLLAERRFAPFFGVQFLGAFNDNVFKQALVILLAYQTATFTAMSSDTLQNLAAALFILPFFLFSATAGQLADKYEKSRLIRSRSMLELAIMAARRGRPLLRSLPLLLAALFLVGVQSTLFGPVKYAILPQQLSEPSWSAATRWSRWARCSRSSLGTIGGGWLIAPAGAGARRRRGRDLRARRRSALALSRFIPRRARGRSRAAHQLEPAQRDLAQPRASRREPHGVPVDARHLLVLVLRRDAGHAVPELRAQRAGRRRARRHAAARGVLGRHRRRLAAVRAAVGPQGRARAGAVRLDRPDAVRLDLCFAVRAARRRARRGRVLRDPRTGACWPTCS